MYTSSVSSPSFLLPDILLNAIESLVLLDNDDDEDADIIVVVADPADPAAAAAAAVVDVPERPYLLRFGRSSFCNVGESNDES